MDSRCFFNVHLPDYFRFCGDARTRQSKTFIGVSARSYFIGWILGLAIFWNSFLAGSSIFCEDSVGSTGRALMFLHLL